jgi:hypothetical protein
VAGVSEAFAWDVADGLPLRMQDGSVLYVSGPGGLPLEQVSGSTVLYYQQDQLGSTRALTDSTGAIAATYSYDAYGNLSSQTGSVSNPFLYTGECRDSESGLYYLRARHYDPATPSSSPATPSWPRPATPTPMSPATRSMQPTLPACAAGTTSSAVLRIW